MKILYKQPANDRIGSLNRFGVQNCYFKKLQLDRYLGMQNSHHHTKFEVHIITEGYQEYLVGDTVYKLESGKFLLIYPNVEHSVIETKPNTKKYSIIFNKHIKDELKCFFGAVPQRILDNIDFIDKEETLKKEISFILIENNILEIIATILRMMGLKEKNYTEIKDENALLGLAKQYIEDNIEKAISVANVSEYCYLSTKQLTRIFNEYEGVTPGEYIKMQRTKRIEKMLEDCTLSLKQISEKMNFENEYYFNSFFKKQVGIPPGKYRKILSE